MKILHGTCIHCNKTNVRLDPEYGICLFNGDECNSYITCRYKMPDGSIIIKKVKCNRDSHGKYVAKAAAPKGYTAWGILS